MKTGVENYLEKIGCDRQVSGSKKGWEGLKRETCNSTTNFVPEKTQKKRERIGRERQY